MATKYIIDNQFYCCMCGSLGLPIVRLRGKEREAGHLKKIYCLKCQKETNHAECQPWNGYTHDDFLAEFNHGNFDEEGNRILSYKEFKKVIRNE